MKKRISDANLVAIMFGCIIVSLVITMIADIIETAPQYELHLVTSHKLVTVQVERQKDINADLSVLEMLKQQSQQYIGIVIKERTEE